MRSYCGNHVDCRLLLSFFCSFFLSFFYQWYYFHRRMRGAHRAEKLRSFDPLSRIIMDNAKNKWHYWIEFRLFIVFFLSFSFYYSGNLVKIVDFYLWRRKVDSVKNWFMKWNWNRIVKRTKTNDLSNWNAMVKNKADMNY